MFPDSRETQDARSLILQSEQKINKWVSVQCGVHYCGFRNRKGAHRLPSFLRCVSNLINSAAPPQPPGALQCHPAYSNLFSLFPGFPPEQHPFRCVEATGFLVNYCVCTSLNMPAWSHVLQGREVFPIHTPKRLVSTFFILFLQSVCLCPKWRKEKRQRLFAWRRISPGLRAGSGCVGPSPIYFYFCKISIRVLPGLSPLVFQSGREWRTGGLHTDAGELPFFEFSVDVKIYMNATGL